MDFSASVATKDAARLRRRRSCTPPRFFSTLPHTLVVAAIREHVESSVVRRVARPAMKRSPAVTVLTSAQESQNDGSARIRVLGCCGRVRRKTDPVFSPCANVRRGLSEQTGWGGTWPPVDYRGRPVNTGASRNSESASAVANTFPVPGCFTCSVCPPLPANTSSTRSSRGGRPFGGVNR